MGAKDNLQQKREAKRRGERVCCSGEEENAEEETGIGWDTPAGASLIKLLMEHQFPEQDSPWLGNESEEESGGSTKMMENSSGMDWLDLMVGEAAEEPGSRNLNLFAVAQDMNVIVQQRQNDNIFLQHASAWMAPSTPTPEPPQSASLAFSKLLGLQDLPSSSHQITPAHLNPWQNSSVHLNSSSGPTQFIDSKNLHFQFHSPLYDFRSHPPSPFLHYSSQFKPSSPLIKMQQQSASDSREPGRKRARITPSLSSIPGIRRSSNSDPSKPKRNGSRNPACHALNTNLKPRAKQGCANDPQSIAARQRRERISERLKILQDLIPNGSKVDLVTMLEKAINYVKFLQLQVKVLMNDEFWATQQEQENPDQPSSDITSSHEYNGSM